MRSLFPRWRFMAEQWPTLTFSGSAIALALTLIITVIILVALFHLTVEELPHGRDLRS